MKTTKYEEMMNYLRNVPTLAATLNFPEIREKARGLEEYLKHLEGCDEDMYISNFYIVSFKPFKKKVDEIINNF